MSTLSGLTTVALLKAFFDHRQDYIGMFQPFILDAIWSLQADGFSSEDIRAVILQKHKLDIPSPIFPMLLRRAVKSRHIRREHGRYFKLGPISADVDISPRKERVIREHSTLGQALQKFATQRGLSIPSGDEALELIIQFLSENRMVVLLEERLPVEEVKRGEMSDRATRIVARFINSQCPPDSELGAFLNRILEGLVLQDTLLLSNISSAPRQFRNLHAFFDSSFLFHVLGYAGDYRKSAALACMDIFKSTNIRLSAFDKTLDEAKHILGIYEDRIGTSEGRRTLHLTELTRYFFDNNYGPAEIHQAISLFEMNIRNLGISVQELPPRDKEYAIDELAFEEALRTPGLHPSSPAEPRVLHDIDCIASIASIRRGLAPATLDDARAVFVTTQSRVIRSINKCWKEAERGISPIIHSYRLSSAAWLKKPAVASDLLSKELIALCSAAIIPSRSVWKRFTRELQQLEEKGELSTEEHVAIVVHSFTHKTLGEMEDYADTPDAVDIHDVIDRVKSHFRAEAEELVREMEESAQSQIEDVQARLAEAQRELQEARGLAGSEAEKRRRQELRLRNLAQKVASCIAWVPFVVLSYFMLLAIGGNLSEQYPRISGILPILRWIGAVLLSLGTLLDFNKNYLMRWRKSLQRWLNNLLCKKLIQ